MEEVLLGGLNVEKVEMGRRIGAATKFMGSCGVLPGWRVANEASRRML
ncbi:hypothetical protein OROMI_021127 [Orobanche minor]